MKVTNNIGQCRILYVIICCEINWIWNTNINVCCILFYVCLLHTILYYVYISSCRWLLPRVVCCVSARSFLMVTVFVTTHKRTVCCLRSRRGIVVPPPMPRNSATVSRRRYSMLKISSHNPRMQICDRKFTVRFICYILFLVDHVET